MTLTSMDDFLTLSRCTIIGVNSSKVLRRIAIEENFNEYIGVIRAKARALPERATNVYF